MGSAWRNATGCRGTDISVRKAGMLTSSTALNPQREASWLRGTGL